MKAVLLAAGEGKRLKPITKSISKLMIPIGPEPFLDYIINDLVSCGFNDLLIVVGHLENQIRKYIKEKNYHKTKIQFITQNEFLGTANAAYCARKFVGENPFLLYLTDTIIPELQNQIKEIVTYNADITILSTNIPSSQVKSSSCILVRNNYVTKIVEKPKKSISNLAWAGVALFNDKIIFDIIKNQKPSHRGEYDITDSINLALKENKKIKNHYCNKFIDSGTPKGLLEATKFILEKFKPHFEEIPKSKNLKIIPPVFIGTNCDFGDNVIIGPFVSLGNEVSIGKNTTLDNSLIFDQTKIDSNKKISHSIIFKNSKINIIC